MNDPLCDESSLVVSIMTKDGDADRIVECRAVAVIGRDTAYDIQLVDPTQGISRRHARISVTWPVEEIHDKLELDLEELYKVQKVTFARPTAEHRSRFPRRMPCTPSPIRSRG